MTVKVFTIEEANKALPSVREAVRFIRAKVFKMSKLQDRMSVLSLIGAENPLSPEYKEWIGLQDEVRAYRRSCNTKLDSLQQIGCVIKDLNHGLVDFYGRKGDRLIFLCWKYGERKISFWHELEAGFSGRRPVSELSEEGEA